MSADGAGAVPTVVVASRGRRALAAVVDGLAIVGPQIALTRWRVRRRAARSTFDLDAAGRRVERAGIATGVALSVARDLGISPGTRLAGIATGRRADGRRLGPARAIAITALDWAPTLAASRATAGQRRSAIAARRARLEAVVRERAGAAAGAPGDRAEDRPARRRVAPYVIARLVITLALKRALRPVRARARRDYAALVRPPRRRRAAMQ